MSIRAVINTDTSGNIIVEMFGVFDYANDISLRQELHILARENPKSTITLNLHSVDFVGSSGIGNFVETVNLLNRSWSQVLLSHVKSEFIKVFRLYKMANIDNIINDIEQDKNFYEKFQGLKKSFQKNNLL